MRIDSIIFLALLATILVGAIAGIQDIAHAQHAFPGH